MNRTTLHLISLSKRWVMTISLLAGIFLLNACAAQKAFRFLPRSITRINYDPNRCTQLPDGRFKCKDVVFTVATVDAKETK